MALTDMQARFCEEYLVDLNATAAAERAGYSAKTARSQGQRLLTNVDIAARIKHLQAGVSRRTKVTVDRVVKEFAKLGFANVDDVAEWGPDGVILKPSPGLSRRVKAAIAEVASRPGKHGTTVVVKFHDKVSALDKLMRHLGGYKDDDDDHEDEPMAPPEPANYIETDMSRRDGRPG